MPSSKVYKAIIWACLSSWFYGYHITELNFPAQSLTCYGRPNEVAPFLPHCIGLDQQRYSAVTAMLTAGGLIGSAVSDRVVSAEGIAGGIVWTGWLNLFGALLMAGAPNWIVMLLGRFVAGLACGLGVCLVPPFLATVARSTPELAGRTGQIGTLHQLAIVLGICSAQIMGLLLTGSKGDKPGAWRYVCLVPGIASLVQIAMTAQNPHGDSKVTEPHPHRDEERASTPTPGGYGANDEAAAPLLGDTPTAPSHANPSDQLSIRDLLSTPALRRPALLTTAILSLQQFSGVNAVLFYSTPVLLALSKPGDTSAGAISIAITVVNAIMTLPAVYLVDRVGRRQLLLWSIVGMGVLSVLLGYGIDQSYRVLSAVSIVAFIACFAFGYGPVPFLLISEMAPPHAVPALSSLALMASWISSFIVAIAFLPLRDWLSVPTDPRDPHSPRKAEGRVFYVFTAMLAISAIVVWRGLPK
ncbi:Bifunctional purine biosynthesis protein PurH [Vanrija albida]|uniref:Bifunctional purine biosynthesis protein PurH n=1 Tax=Vanrija albida TaxID=181172 RepID=A0ABR3QE38_9TREE